MAAKRTNRKVPAARKKSKPAAKTASRTASKKSVKKAPARKKAAAPTKKPAAGKKVAARPARKPASNDPVDRIQRLIAVMTDAGAVEVEMEDSGTKLRVRLKEEHPPVAYAAPPLAMSTPAAGGAPIAAHAGRDEVEPSAAEADAEAREVFESPMLGTFYRAPSPEAEPFMRVGDRVEVDGTLCIIEAMKVMNEIKAEHEFEIVEILVQNGDPVEYGQPLFLIRS